MRRDEKNSGDMRREENSCDQPRRAEQGRENLRWDEMRWGGKAEKTWNEISWHEVGWHRLRSQWDAMSNFQEKLRCDEIRWNEKRSDIQKTWYQIDKFGDCCCEAEKVCQHPIVTVLVPLYRLLAFQFWNFRPRYVRELLVFSSAHSDTGSSTIQDLRKSVHFFALKLHISTKSE